MRRSFGDRLVLIGSNWRGFGLGADPSAYSFEARLRLYESAAVNLDCGSKSGDAALYPRSSEIISYAGAPLQLSCVDSTFVYGPLAGEIVFDRDQDLHALIERRLAEPAGERADRAARLAAHLEGRGLTMAHSFQTLFASGDRRTPLRGAPR